MERCTKPLGQTAVEKFLYPELGSIPIERAAGTSASRQLASLVTSKKNGRLTRTIVNRLWQRLMGRGLIEPVDEMDNKPWNADLLDWLAWDLPQALRPEEDDRDDRAVPRVSIARGAGG